jgi:aryl-alcohol dehydrogenase-like predicted oxidoreductase
VSAVEAGILPLRDLGKGDHLRAAGAGLALALAQGQGLVPIPGTRSAERVAENVAAAADVALDEAEFRRVQEILPDGAHGARYPASMMPVWK